MKDLSLEQRKNNIYYDKNGRQILEGDLLKIFHFRTKSKIHYMYHAAVMEQTKDFPVMSGRDYDADKPHYRFYVIANDNRVYEKAEIVSERDWESKRLKIKL
ncbi:hypothetical protein [Sphingobacterium sp.]|uniref:hypothetical protein n=1 Tax=Sphingobacterium sp. TaxID=341027 RepID=UPI00289D43AC|nr:hypothetical protein [Sphingobacterium sp.]